MTDIVFSISEENLSLILSSISVLFFIVAVFFLAGIKKRVSENLNKTFVYLIISCSLRIFISLLIILENLRILSSFSYDAFIILPAFFFLLAIINFYKSIAQQVRTRTPRVHHKVHHRSVRKR